MGFKEMKNTEGGLVAALFFCALIVLAPIAGWYSTPHRSALGQPY